MVKRLLVKYPNMPSRKLARLAGVSHTAIAKLWQPQEEDKTYITLMNAWGKASMEAQEKFVREN